VIADLVVTFAAVVVAVVAVADVIAIDY
jgi:hypothetical protein